MSHNDQCPTSHCESDTSRVTTSHTRMPKRPSTYPEPSNEPCLRLGDAYTRDPNELVRREAGPSTTSLPGPWGEAPNAPPGSPGCARPMSTLQMYANTTTHTIESPIQTRQYMRHHDSHYVIHCVTTHHSESHLDTTDITAPRPPVWPHSYISVDHTASRRYGRCHHPPIRLEPDHGQRHECVDSGWVRGKGRCRRDLVVLKREPGLADC